MLSARGLNDEAGSGVEVADFAGGDLCSGPAEGVTDCFVGFAISFPVFGSLIIRPFDLGGILKLGRGPGLALCWLGIEVGLVFSDDAGTEYAKLDVGRCSDIREDVREVGIADWFGY